MLQPRIAPQSRHSTICLRCQFQLPLRKRVIFQSPIRTITSTSSLRKSSSSNEGKFVPKLLGRPIGFQRAPQPGENTGDEPKKKYTGSLRERNLARREDLQHEWSRNYFRDSINVRKYKGGKTFMANPLIFRKDVSLYFPNLRGQTLKEKKVDTTPVLKGKVSVVNVYGSTWGQNQAESFTGEKANPRLYELLAEHTDVAQRVEINIEENPLKRWLLALFHWRLKRQMPEENWGRYFIVWRGVSTKIRETIGTLNARVGYVYLVDQDCKIRWAGSGDAEGTEIQHLNKGFQKMIDDAKSTRLGRRVQRQDIGKEAEAQAVNARAS
ncbi:hypothetical protein EJ04DRAFT_276674 [Polyplosphaeria fusca]|uniref:Mitochondrial ATPase complex subunit ATP10 n=1 Tax=Polyplosphaeria fusca TaxID=682080 RepID=A0A9P4QY79_9PLEO|nr:hypothetical protein EJ04DRAFT_276674 [Polyplosphaeria fusca]